MTVKTAKVTGRRELHFESLDDILHDAEHLASVETKELGNWSKGQIFKHLAIVKNLAIDGSTYRPPWFIRWIAKMMKKRFLTKTMRPGFQLPKKAMPIFAPPDDVSTEEGLAALREAIARLKSTDERAPNMIFGKMTVDEYTQLHCRHSELHLSFIVPVDAE